MYVTLSSFYLFLWNYTLKLNKTLHEYQFMYAVILTLHNFDLRGQTNVAFRKICYKT